MKNQQKTNHSHKKYTSNKKDRGFIKLDLPSFSSGKEE